MCSPNLVTLIFEHIPTVSVMIVPPENSLADSELFQLTGI